MKPNPSLGAASLTAVALAASSLAPAQEAPSYRSAEVLEAFLADHARLVVHLPERGYAWRDDDLAGDLTRGSLTVDQTSVIYYFVHWGPIEVPEITEEYARTRIPEIWPNEGLEVLETEPTTVAGHPAVYAEVLPKRQFYRAFFVVWNCPESGRQLIADMNYNVAVRTPRAELDAEIAVTRRSLACHPGAPVSPPAEHAASYHNTIYRLDFNHPLRWYVRDNPFGVPLPAFRGLRDASVGSVLGWLQDMETTLGFAWKPAPAASEHDGLSMGGPDGLIRAAAEHALTLDRVADFVTDETEVLRIASLPVLKLTGTAELVPPETTGTDASPRDRLMVLAADLVTSGRRVLISVRIPYHRLDGQWVAPHRAILDEWAAQIVGGLGPT